MKIVPKKRSLYLAISCIIATTPCYAASSQNPISVTDGSTYTITDDSIISVPSLSSGNPAILVGSPNGGIVNGGALKIDTDGIGIKVYLYNNYTIPQGNGIVNLGTTEINSKNTSISADTYNFNYKAEIHLGDNSKITSSEGTAIDAHRNGLVTIGNNAEIKGNTYGPTVAVVSASSGGKIEIGDYAKITQTGGQTTNGGNRIAVHAYNSSEYNPATDNSANPFDNPYKGYIKIGDNSEIKSLGSGEGSSAVVTGWVFNNNVLYGGNISIGKNADISTVGQKAHAVWSRHGDSNIEIGAGSTIATQGSSSSAVQAGIIAGSNYISGGTINIGEKSTIKTQGTSAYGLYSLGADSIINLADSSSIKTDGISAYGVYATRGGTVNLTNTSITTGGTSGIGLNAGNGVLSSAPEKGIINVNGISIITSGQNAHGIQVTRNGEVNLSGTVAISVDSSKNAYAITAGQQGTVSGKAVYDITGNMNVTSTGVIDLEFEENSIFTGKTSFSGTSATLSLDMTKSLWNVTGNSTLTHLTLNNATVDLTSAELGTTVNIKNLSTANPASNATNGYFALKTDIIAGTGDKIITETTDGYHILSIHNQGSAETDGTETLTVVETGDGNGDFKVLNDNVEIGAWLYGLRRTEDNQNNWELYGTGKSGPIASAAVNTFMGAYLLSYAETQTLVQRLGDLRDTPSAAGFWFRGYGGQMESNSRSFVRGFDMDYSGMQMGYDRKIKTNKKGTTYIGGMIGYSKGDINYSMDKSGTGGNSDIDSKTVGLYTTYIQDNGFYADALLKYMWLKNKFNVLDTVGDRVTGDNVSTGGMGFSIELGKRFKFKQNEQGEAWYVEPQIQYSYTHQDGGNFHASNGLKIGVDSFTSSLGRIGFRIGYETKKTNLYLKASYEKEFDGDVNIVANNMDIPESFGDNWWVYGVGYTSQINDRNNIYLSVERAQGGKFTEPWKIYAGWRLSF
ncbi:autotransporter outer membrane beta-barrel domain-containing protein [Selenomonadales bacterium OttesenSCG-928-I06]|nr:autotransporter outer membrane beta-barrel domain-containing protein [Selenomonadales bacterium OttesenSCG-928-I06]